MMGWYDDASTGYGWWMVVMMLLLVAAVAVGVWALVNGVRRSGSTTASPTPRAVLDRRLASGEIDAESYAELRRLLENGPSRAATGEPGSGAR